jgi:hypothetical protein
VAFLAGIGAWNCSGPERAIRSYDYLTLVQTNASDCLTNIQPKTLLVVTDVARCSAQFSQFSNLITGKVHDWKGGSPARQDSLDLLQAFQQHCRPSSTM